jgi:glucose-6-phosphate 1-dehydrogenase
MTHDAMEAQTEVNFNKNFCFLENAGPCGLTLFGARSDLARRKLYISLYSLMASGALNKSFYLLGSSRTPLSDGEFRKLVSESLRESGARIDLRIEKEFLEHCYYETLDIETGGEFQGLARRVGELDSRHKTKGNQIFYLSISPVLYGKVIAGISEAGLTQEKTGAVRIIIEKPFGRDLKSAHELDQAMKLSLKESQIYRMDHYLGKETVQNILMFRFANSIFEPLWSRRYIDHVQITVAEDLGVGEHRSEYYEAAGCLRDVFQNHLLQLLALVAMEPPSGFRAEEVREERAKVYRAIRPFEAGAIDSLAVRGQYGPGIINGKKIPGYREIGKTRAQSNIDTYAAVKIMIDNWRWEGVPFYLRAGKGLAKKLSEIAIEFKPVPHLMFNPLMADAIPPNRLVLRIQPEERITLTFQAKHPGSKICMGDVTMDFCYKTAFGEAPPEAYERLLLDCMLGDQTLFARQDSVEIAWELLDPILRAWGKVSPKNFPNYAAGSQGPKEADELIARDGRAWRSL